MTNQNKFQTAFAEVEITPNFPVTLVGGIPVTSQKVLHPLMSQVLLMKWKEKLTCLITIDNLGLTVNLANEIRQATASQLGITEEEVMLCFSHTHNAPQPTAEALNGERYFAFMLGRIGQGVAQALTNLKLSKVSWGLAESKIGVNRREGCSVVDNRLGVLKIATDQLSVVVIRLAAHPNSLISMSGMITSDYIHFVRQQLAAYFDCPVMIVQGAAGNIKVKGTDTIKGGTLQDAEAVATAIINSLSAITDKLTEVSKFQLFSKELSFISEVPDLATSQKIAFDAQKECGIDGSRWLEECQHLRKSGVEQQVTCREVQFLRINDGWFCGVPDELFCESALAVMRKTSNPLFFLNGYTNGCTGYLATEKEWLVGGYEVLYSYLVFFPFHGHVMPFRRETADQLVEFIVKISALKE